MQRRNKDKNKNVNKPLHDSLSCCRLQIQNHMETSYCVRALFMRWRHRGVTIRSSESNGVSSGQFCEYNACDVIAVPLSRAYVCFFFFAAKFGERERAIDQESHIMYHALARKYLASLGICYQQRARVYFWRQQLLLLTPVGQQLQPRGTRLGAIVACVHVRPPALALCCADYFARFCVGSTHLWQELSASCDIRM